MAMLSSYRTVLSVPGAALFCLTGLVARMPISMAGLGIVLAVEGATGSYGTAGAVSAAYMVANALLAIVQGRLIDRLGQARVLALAAGVFGVAMAVLIWSVSTDQTALVSYLCAAVAGGSLPQIASCVRARWSHVLTDSRQISTAYALEAVADEVVFITGPIIVTLVATTVHPTAGLAVTAVVGVLGTLAFAGQRRTEPPTHRQRSVTDRAPLPWRTLVPLAIVCLALGVLFGAAEVTTVAFADEHDVPAAAGLLLAAWALGSLASGVVTGAVHWQTGPDVRVRWGALAMAAAMVPLYFAPSVPVLGLLLLVGGCTIAPTMVATMSLTAQSVPPARLTEGMAIMQTGLVAGVAPGASISGLVVDHHGASAAFLVSVAAGLVAAGAALVLPRSRTSSEVAV